jgi:copper chaperone CopZ
MEAALQREYILEGLCCPNCAADIDEKVKRLPEVKQASVDFPNTRLTLEFEGDEKTFAEFFLKCEFYGEKLRKESGSLRPCGDDC